MKHLDILTMPVGLVPVEDRSEPFGTQALTSNGAKP
jgi:hypothetical protein